MSAWWWPMVGWVAMILFAIRHGGSAWLFVPLHGALLGPICIAFLFLTTADEWFETGRHWRAPWPRVWK